MIIQGLLWLLPGAFCAPWVSGTDFMSWGVAPGGLHSYKHGSLGDPWFQAPGKTIPCHIPVG